MEELKRCPFCNGSKGLSVQDTSKGFIWQYYVSCLACGTNGPKCRTEEEAIRQWNQRWVKRTGRLGKEDAE